MKTQDARSHAAQQGFALIVALVLLLVMTMVAVVAMRSTTLDLKMTTNSALNRRAFQASEGMRMLIGPILDAHTYHQGKWPKALDPNSPIGNLEYGVPELDKFKNFISDMDLDPAKAPFRQPYPLKEPPVRKHDFLFVDPAFNGKVEDIRTKVWVTKLGEKPDSGKILGQDTALNYGIYQIRAEGRSAGNAKVVTTADFRALLN